MHEVLRRETLCPAYLLKQRSEIREIGLSYRCASKWNGSGPTKQMFARVNSRHWILLTEDLAHPAIEYRKAPTTHQPRWAFESVFLNAPSRVVRSNRYHI